jgi:hypothetical protein
MPRSKSAVAVKTGVRYRAVTPINAGDNQFAEGDEVAGLSAKDMGELLDSGAIEPVETLEAK